MLKKLLDIKYIKVKVIFTILNNRLYNFILLYIYSNTLKNV